MLNEIDAGTWHLKVDAEDDSGLVLYTGETDVQVFAGFTSQVYLHFNRQALVLVPFISMLFGVVRKTKPGWIIFIIL